MGGACRVSPYTIIIPPPTWYLLFFVARFTSIIFVSLPIAISMPGWPETIFILVVVVLLFGAKKLPELARGLGQSWGNSRKPEMSSSASFTAPPPKSNLRRLPKSSHLLKHPKGRFPWKVQFRGAKEQKRQADDKSGICLGLICTQEGARIDRVGENKRVTRSRPFENHASPGSRALGPTRTSCARLYATSFVVVEVEAS